MVGLQRSKQKVPLFFSRLFLVKFLAALPLRLTPVPGVKPELASGDLGTLSRFLQVLTTKVVGREAGEAQQPRQGHLQVGVRED